MPINLTGSTVKSRANINRRKVLTGLSATILVPRPARAFALTNPTGRAVAIPDKVEHIFPAGPPTSLLIYTFAPDLLLGWTRNPDPPQCALLGSGACDNPEVGRLPGRGNRTNPQAL